MNTHTHNASTALALTLAATFAAGAWAQQDKPEWALNATLIEACSCTMFCPCYFSTKPSAHAGHGEHAEHGGSEHFCKFNMAYKVNSGHHGDTSLDGMEFWLAGDLGSGWADGTMNWAQVTFEPDTSKAQRDAILAIVPHIYPAKWESFTVAEEDAEVEWKMEGEKAVAKLAGGKKGEMVLKHLPTHNGEPVVIQNLIYWGVPRHEGFVLMPNEVEAYRYGENAFEFKGTNGFMITLDITSNDVKKS